MGGAERSARRRRQAELAAAPQPRQRGVAAAAGGAERTRKVVLAAAGALVIAAVVIGGLLWTNADKNATEGQAVPVQTSHADIPSAREGVVVVTGSADAKVTVDVYADFLCPACRQFEEIYGDRIAERVKAGEVRVRTHMIPMLVNRSDPPGYSLDAANAGLCAADEGKFVPFHDSLFAAQPDEGKRGYDKAQLITLGRDLGISSATFPSCVNGGTYDDQLTAEFEQVKVDPKLQQDFGNGAGFGTPTITSGGKIVDVGNDAWLTDLLAAGQG